MTPLCELRYWLVTATSATSALGDAERRSAFCVEVAEREVERLCGICAGHPGHRARHECECQECDDENESPSRRRYSHCGFSPPWSRADQLALGELPQTAADDDISGAAAQTPSDTRGLAGCVRWVRRVANAVPSVGEADRLVGDQADAERGDERERRERRQLERRAG